MSYGCTLPKTSLPFTILDSINECKDTNGCSNHSSAGDSFACHKCSEQNVKLNELLSQEAFDGSWGWNITNDRQEIRDRGDDPNMFINSIGAFISKYGFKNKELIEKERQYIETLIEPGADRRYCLRSFPTYEKLVNSKYYKEVITMINYHRQYTNKKYRMIRKIIIKEYKFINSIYGVNNKYTNKTAYEKLDDDYSNKSGLKIFNCDCKYHSMLTMYGKTDEYFGSSSYSRGYKYRTYRFEGLNLPYYVIGDT